MDVYLRFALALAFVLALLAVVGWAARRYGIGEKLAGAARAGRRLALIEVLPVDAKRRLALVRRDGTEHLILLGAGGDLIIETGIATPPSTASEPQPAVRGLAERLKTQLGARPGHTP
jgi:flagellar protein FliO/FliZ